MSAWKQRESRLSPASSLPAAEDSCFVSRRRFSDGVHFSKSQARLGECKESRNVDDDPDNRRNRCVVFHFGVGPARPEVPESLKAPASEEGILMGTQRACRYTCAKPRAEQKSTWVLKAPEAELTDAAGKKIIHHFAGPSWKHVDGSEVTGKLAARQDAPKPDAIPWLLLSAASHTGEGILARVTSIQRINTEGGLPPKAGDCTVAANGAESKSAYSADYYFYAPAKQ